MLYELFGLFVTESLNLFIHEINFTKLPHENYQNTGAGYVVKCDKPKLGCTKKVMHWCLGTTRI